VKGMKEESGGKKVTSYKRFICERERTLYVVYLESGENRSNVMKFRSFGDRTSSRVDDELKTIRLINMYRLSRRELQ